MKYSAVIFTFGTRSTDQLRNSNDKWGKLFDDVCDVNPLDGYTAHTGKDKNVHDLRPLVGRRGSTHIIYVPTLAEVTTEEPGRARTRVMNYLPDAAFAIAVGFIGSHDLSYGHGHIILPKRAFMSNLLKNHLKRMFGEEAVCGYATQEILSGLYDKCRREQLPAHLVDTTFSVMNEKETLRENSSKLFELGYVGRDMELAWVLAFANQHSKPAGAMLVVSDMVKANGEHENPFGDVSKGEEVFIVPEIAKENTRKALNAATLYVLDKS